MWSVSSVTFILSSLTFDAVKIKLTSVHLIQFNPVFNLKSNVLAPPVILPGNQHRRNLTVRVPEVPGVQEST